jgi:hypothetical protein
VGVITLTPYIAGGTHQYALMVTLSLAHLPYYDECTSLMQDWCDDTFGHPATLVNANYFYFEKQADRDWFILRWS